MTSEKPPTCGHRQSIRRKGEEGEMYRSR